jgi:hypothetical protein
VDTTYNKSQKECKKKLPEHSSTDIPEVRHGIKPLKSCSKFVSNEVRGAV